MAPTRQPSKGPSQPPLTPPLHSSSPYGPATAQEPGRDLSTGLLVCAASGSASKALIDAQTIILRPSDLARRRVWEPPDSAGFTFGAAHAPPLHGTAPCGPTATQGTADGSSRVSSCVPHRTLRLGGVLDAYISRDGRHPGHGLALSDSKLISSRFCPHQGDPDILPLARQKMNIEYGRLGSRASTGPCPSIDERACGTFQPPFSLPDR